MKVREAEVRQMFSDMGWEHAIDATNHWTRNQLTKNLNRLPALLDQAKDVEGKSLALLKAVTEALENGEEIELERDEEEATDEEEKPTKSKSKKGGKVAVAEKNGSTRHSEEKTNPDKKKPKEKKPRGVRIFDYSPSAISQWMAMEGYVFEDIRKFLDLMGAKETKDSTIKTAISDSKSERYAKIAPVTAKEGKEIKEKLGVKPKAPKKEKVKSE